MFAPVFIFFAFLLSFCLSPFAFRFISLLQLFVLRLVCFVMVVFCLFSCLVLFVLVSLWLLLLFLFPLRMNRQKERAQSVFASSLVLLWACLDVLKHYRYFLCFVVPMSSSFTDNSCNLFRMLRCVFSFLPVFIYH